MNKKNKYDYSLFHDTDIIVNSFFLKNLILNINYFNYPNCIQTYGKKRLLLTKEFLGKNILDEKINVDDLSENTDGVFINPAVYKGAHSKGGSILVKNTKYIEVGGHDHEIFNGYAPEDAMFWDKITLNSEVYSADYPLINMFHIWHPSAANSNPNLNEMEESYKKFVSLPKEEKNKYIIEAKDHLEKLSNKIITPEEYYEKTLFDTGKNIVSFNRLGKLGRLGNQMFQVAATLSYAIDNNFGVNLNWENSYSNVNYLNYFKNTIPRKKNINNFSNYVEANLNFKQIPNLNKNINLDGFFQSEKYFKKNEKIIRHFFTPNGELINNINNKYGHILKLETCSIHVRRTDYINNKSHDLCNLNFYLKCIEKIKTIVNVDNFLIFSDDINWCKKNLSSDYIFIENNIDIYDLFLMSMCKHNIISNSSFSWWASWLNTNINKIVIAPDRWFPEGSSLENKDIYRDDMMRIKV